jgi:hypothetical protein
MCWSRNACLHMLIYQTEHCHVQNHYQRHFNRADRVLTGGCSIGSQYIWNEMLIALVILGICIKIGLSTAGKWSPFLPISELHAMASGCVSSHTVTGRHKGHSKQMCHGLCSPQSKSVWCWWIRALAPPGCLQILCSALLAMTAAISLILPKLSQVCYHGSCHTSLPRKLHSTHPLFLDVSVR